LKQVKSRSRPPCTILARIKADCYAAPRRIIRIVRSREGDLVSGGRPSKLHNWSTVNQLIECDNPVTVQVELV
jgi:hypothetical protein